MKTGSLRARVILTTLALFAIVLTVVVTAVTLAYRAELDGQLRSRLADAGAAVERSDPRDLKPLIPVLALEGFATRLSGPVVAASRPAPTGAPATGTAGTGSTIPPPASLLVLHDGLPGATPVSLSPRPPTSPHPPPNPPPVQLLATTPPL